MDFTLAEDFVGRLNVVLKRRLRVMRQQERLMSARDFVTLVADRLEVVS